MTSEPPAQRQAGRPPMTLGAPSDLLAMALSVPEEALDRAVRLLELKPDDIAASYGHQAAGIVLRERGELPAALRHLAAALVSARSARNKQRMVDVAATLGATEVMAGRTKAGLAHLDGALSNSRGL